MSRYFLEVSYKGTHYSGFQTQENANSIQNEVEKAFAILQREKVEMTGSSRTDAGVHALQNFFHFDYEGIIHPQFLYKLNAILPADTVAKGIRAVSPDSHCRYDAVSREYKYYIYSQKNPFIQDRAYYFPYRMNLEKLRMAASAVMDFSDFTSFSKRNTQVKNFECSIHKSEWSVDENGCLIYHVIGNRFLRGMVRALTATMLKVGREKIEVSQFRKIIEARNCTLASFAVPAHGLFLTAVNF